MIRMMATRNLKARYVGSFFGFFWAVLNPLAQLAIFGLVFGVFFNSRPDPVYDTDSFFLFLLCGLVPWQFFAETVGVSTDVLVSNSNLIKKSVGFHSEILPVINVITSVVNHLIGIALVLLILLLFGVRFSFYLPLIFVYLLFISVFCVGIGWVLSSVNVYLRDVQQVVALAITALFFLTPIFYSPSIIPSKAAWVAKLNPMFHMVEGYRLALLAGSPLPFWDFTYFAVVSCLTFGLGGLFFRILKPGFAEVL